MRSLGFGGLYPGMVGLSRGRRGGGGVAWTVDATSGIATPANATEWAVFIAAKGLSIPVPDPLWAFQDPSGNAADAIGAFPLTASGTGLAYRQSVAGWSRKAITFTEGNSGSLASISTSLPDISAASQFTVLFAKVTTPTSTRRIVGQGTTRSEMRIITTPVIQVMSGANTANGAVNPTGSVKPFGLRTNHTAGSTTGFTDVSKIIPTFGTLGGKKVCFGANGDTNSPTASMLYAFEWHNVNAEISDANYKALLTAMGFTITWV